MCNNHKHFMQAAIDEAEKNLLTNDGGPFGAVIVKDGKIIARGHNEVLKNNDPTCHAEMQTIRAACEALGTFDLSGCELYTSCYPCPMCLSATIWANIKVVYYGNTAKDAADIGFRDDYIYDFIKAVQMPLFMIVSGYLCGQGRKITDLKTLNGLAALFNENPECRKLFIQTAEQIEAKRKR